MNKSTIIDDYTVLYQLHGFKINVKIFLIVKICVTIFSAEHNFAASSTCLCTAFGWVAKIKTMFTLSRKMLFGNDLCCGWALCPYCFDVIRKINRSNSDLLKKVERSDFGIHFSKCESHETEQGSEKNRIFPLEVLFLELYSYNHLFSAIFGYP